ncbi:MAG: thioredoxin family protein [Gammaproteobacteria bacterium]|nr:thioredoxin family protein [Gammaproteobacteria bacterium]
MKQVSDGDLLEQLKTEGAVIILFGGEHCAVCRSLRPQLESILATRFPSMTAAYIDCEKSPAICAQHHVFALPAVTVYIEGKLSIEEARAFSLTELMRRMERSYTLWIESKNQ